MTGGERLWRSTPNGNRRGSIGNVVRLASTAVVLIFACCSAKPGGPISVDATSGYCPVCKMKVNAADRYASEIVYTDNTKLLFESQGDLLWFYFAPDFPQPERFDVSATQADHRNIARILVKDYNTTSQIEGREAMLVYKSKVQSLMGPDVFAFTNRDEAEKFAAVNGGRVMTFGELTPQMVLHLRNKE
jgi:nitrous oxide reductase accessory protein NosL